VEVQRVLETIMNYTEQQTAVEGRHNLMNQLNQASALRRAFPTTTDRLLVSALAGLAAITSAFAQPRFVITDLGTLPGTASSVANGLNDHGDVVGYCAPVAGDFNETGFVWHSGVMTSTGKLPKGLYSYANAINALPTAYMVVENDRTGLPILKKK